MYPLLIIFFVIISIAMILIVLIQESKGGGLASSFSSSNQILGVRKTTDFIEKATWGLAVVLVVLSISCAWLVPTAATSSSIIENAATEQAPLGSKTLPGFDASQTKKTPVAGSNEGKQTSEAAAETPAETPAMPAAPAK